MQKPIKMMKAPKGIRLEYKNVNHIISMISAYPFPCRSGNLSDDWPNAL